MSRRFTSGAGRARRLLRFLTFGMVVASGLVACGSETKPVAGYDEVVARVNGEEITVHQLNERLARIGPLADGDQGAARKRLLDMMIDERLLMQKAIARGLDKEQATRSAIEFARRQLLAQAAVEETSGDPEVSEKEATAFYHANPDLFGKRKVYTFRRFLLPNGNLDGAAKARLQSAKTAAHVEAILRNSGIAYSLVTELQTAESLAAPTLARAARMAPGDILLFAEGSRTILLQFAGSIAEPISLDVAMPSIQEYLANARRQKNAERLVKDLRRKAKIEYVMQTVQATKPTALADGKQLLGEPPLKKPLQSQQMTVVR